MSHFEKQKNKFNACDFCLSVSAVLPFPNTSLLMPFFTFNDVFTYFPKNLDQFYIFLQYLFHTVFLILSFHS